MSNDPKIMSLEKLRTSIEAQAPYDSVRCIINSFGGGCSEGLAMYDYLRSLDVPITTIVNGICWSIAGPVFMAGDTRLISSSSNLMIHPVEGQAQGTANDFRAYADLMDKYGDKIVGIYVDKTGLPEATIRAYMATETYIESGQCVEQKFATGLYTIENLVADGKLFITNMHRLSSSNPAPLPVKSLPVKPIKTRPMATTKPTPAQNAAKTILSFVNKLLGVSNAEIPLANGTTVYTESESPAVGDSVYSDAELTTLVADGVHDTAEGGKITTVAGIITDIVGATSNEEQPTDSAEVTALRNQVAKLEAQIAADKVTNEAKQTETNEALTLIASNMKIILGSSHSVDVDLTPKTNNKGKAVIDTKSDYETNRAKMLAEHEAKFAPKVAEVVRQ